MSKNVLLAVLSVVVTWLLLEGLVFPLALPLLPLRIHAGLPRPLRPLAQSSKLGTVPSHYVALIGDSNAQGAGDWMLSVDAARNPAFHSAHLIHQQTERDVISFGASGAGSLRAMGTEPQAYVDTLQRSWRYRLPDPELLLVYFYEGNDLQDNLRDLDHTYFGGGFDPARIYDGGYFRDFVRKTAATRTPVAEELETWRWTDNFFLTRFVFRVIRALVDRSWQASEPAPDWSPGSVSRAVIDGAERALPNGLQGSPVELSLDELELALWADAQAFALLRERFPRARTLVVYLPSPLATYRITSPEVDVQVQRGGGPTRFTREALAERSDLVCQRIEAVTRAGGGEFVDARPALWESAGQQPVHGPLDWKHLNRVGQERLAGLVVSALGTREHGSCASLRARLEGGS